MRTLIPEAMEAVAQPLGRWGRWLGFGLTRRALLLGLAGLVWAVPAFFHPHRLWMMGVWDALLLGVVCVEWAALPAPAQITVRRRFLDSPRLGEATRIELEVEQRSGRVLEVDVTDDLDASLMPVPGPSRVVAYPRDPVRAALTCFPGARGDVGLGDIFVRYRASLKLVERWAVCRSAQEIRVFPAFEQNRADTTLLLVRARLEMQKRKLRLRGAGRDFESLREYVAGDELRTLSWTATARRGRLITRQYTTERSQQVWMVLDAGRLSRTAAVLRREEGSRQTVTQLDQAASAVIVLAEAVEGSGDKSGLLTYGRGVQQQLLPGAGVAHRRTMIDQLARVQGEAAEADHLHAVARLKQMQRRRSLVVWITEIADSVGRPEVVAAAADLVRRHLVLLVLLRHAEVEALAARPPGTVEEMYASTAAVEMLERRRETVAALRGQGVLVVESTPDEVGVRAINSYLEIKARGLL